MLAGAVTPGAHWRFPQRAGAGMELLIILGGLVAVVAIAVIAWPLLAGIAVIAFLSWVLGIPFWLGLIIGGAVAAIAAVLSSTS